MHPALSMQAVCPPVREEGRELGAQKQPKTLLCRGRGGGVSINSQTLLPSLPHPMWGIWWIPSVLAPGISLTPASGPRLHHRAESLC